MNRINNITIKKFSKLSGYSENAIRSKIQRGDWLEGEVWTRAPDNKPLIDLNGYDLWVKSCKKGAAND